MDTNKIPNSKLVEGGMDNFERTEQFHLKVSEIKRELTAKYFLMLSCETNWLKRVLIKIRLKIAIDKRIDELSSNKNLHSVILDFT